MVLGRGIQRDRLPTVPVQTGQLELLNEKAVNRRLLYWL